MKLEDKRLEEMKETAKKLIDESDMIFAVTPDDWVIHGTQKKCIGALLTGLVVTSDVLKISPSDLVKILAKATKDLEVDKNVR